MANQPRTARTARLCDMARLTSSLCFISVVPRPGVHKVHTTLGCSQMEFYRRGHPGNHPPDQGVRCLQPPRAPSCPLPAPTAEANAVLASHPRPFVCPRTSHRWTHPEMASPPGTSAHVACGLPYPGEWSDPLAAGSPPLHGPVISWGTEVDLGDIYQGVQGCTFNKWPRWEPRMLPRCPTTLPDKGR